MEHWIFNLLIVVAAFLAMEFVAYLTHRFVMHGILWTLHEDHHKRNRNVVFEKNDFFFLLFATPGITFLYLGMTDDFSPLFFIGLGITLYGMAYFFVHDLFIHQRLKVLRNTKSTYFNAIRRGHKAHHKHLEKHDGESFGMLWVPLKYFTQAAKSQQR